MFCRTRHRWISALAADWGGALISGLGVIPYAGDIAKVGKITKDVKIINKAIDAVKVADKAKDAKKIKNVTKTYPNRKAALEARPKPKPAQSGKQQVTNQTRNKSGEGNKFKTDKGKQTPHVHDRNHNNKSKPNVHYRVGTKKIKPGE